MRCKRKRNALSSGDKKPSTAVFAYLCRRACALLTEFCFAKLAGLVSTTVFAFRRVRTRNFAQQIRPRSLSARNLAREIRPRGFVARNFARKFVRAVCRQGILRNKFVRAVCRQGIWRNKFVHAVLRQGIWREKFVRAVCRQGIWRNKFVRALLHQNIFHIFSFPHLTIFSKKYITISSLQRRCEQFSFSRELSTSPFCFVRVSRQVA